MKLKILQKRLFSLKIRWKIRFFFQRKNHVFTNPRIQMLSTKIIGFPFQICNFNAKSTFSSLPVYRCLKNRSFLFKMWWKIVVFHEKWSIFMKNRWFHDKNRCLSTQKSMICMKKRWFFLRTETIDFEACSLRWTTTDHARNWREKNILQNNDSCINTSF